jgi:hypothetical protein
MLFQIDYTITSGTRYMSTGDYSRVVDAKNITNAKEVFAEYIGDCKYTINEISKI